MNKYYLVEAGEVTEINENVCDLIEIAKNVDWDTQALCYAADEKAALDLAKLYDNGKIKYDNVQLRCFDRIDDEPIAVLR